MRILYQPYMGLKGTAVGLIDQGFVNAIKALGYQCIVWDADNQPDKISSILHKFKPTHFLGYLQNAYRLNTGWTQPKILNELCHYKNKYGLKVIIDSFPSNLKALFKEWISGIEAHVDAGVASYYLQENRPNTCEKIVFESRLIDIITSRFSSESFPLAYQNFLAQGITVLEMPPAADSTIFTHDMEIENQEHDIDLLYIGGCWSFKWDNMKKYVIPLKEYFGDQFKIYGSGWPDSFSEGSLGENVSDNNLFIRYSQRAKINLAFHEPSQVLSFANSGNERVYKLLALGACVLSDPCATFRNYFSNDKDLAIAYSGADMVQQAGKLLMDKEKRKSLAHTGKETIFYDHTYVERIKRIITVCNGRYSGIVTYKEKI